MVTPCAMNYYVQGYKSDGKLKFRLSLCFTVCNSAALEFVIVLNLSQCAAKRQIKKGRRSALFYLQKRSLRSLYQLHFAVFLAMQHLDPALRIAENKHLAIAKLGLLDGFFQSERLK